MLGWWGGPPRNGSRRTHQPSAAFTPGTDSANRSACSRSSGRPGECRFSSRLIASGSRSARRMHRYPPIELPMVAQPRMPTCSANAPIQPASTSGW